MEKLIEYIAEGLVNDADAVEVRRVSDDAHDYELFVDESDRGKVIGRKGRTANSIRTVLVAATGDRDARLDIVD